MRRCKRLLIFLVLVSISTISCAQDYGVTYRGDTLRGKIKILNYGSEKKIQIITSDQKKHSIPILQVKSFVFENEMFRPVKGPTGYVFMKLIKEGYLSLYAFQFPNQTNFDGLYLTRKDGPAIEVPNLKFRKTMKKFLAGCPAATDKIEDGTFAKKDLLAIVDYYNACIAQKSDELVPTTKAAEPEVVAPTQSEPPISSPSSPWDDLEASVQSLDDFAGKADALDMITEIRNKSSRGEKIPNFLIEGLKSALKDKGVDSALNAALAQIK
jgi:hypothetical protein